MVISEHFLKLTFRCSQENAPQYSSLVQKVNLRKPRFLWKTVIHLKRNSSFYLLIRQKLDKVAEIAKLYHYSSMSSIIQDKYKNGIFYYLPTYSK